MAGHSQEQGERPAPDRRIQRRPYYGYSLGQLTSAPEAIYFSKSMPMYQAQMSWNSPVSNRLLLEGGVALQQQELLDRAAAGQRCRTRSRTSDLGTGFSWGNYGRTYGNNGARTSTRVLPASYVTGSHAFKAGLDVHAPMGRHWIQRREQRHDPAID